MRNSTRLLLTAIACAPLLALGVACGGDDDDDSSSSSYTCCLNGSFYTCPDSASVDQCGSQGDPSACTREVSRDSECD